MQYIRRLINCKSSDKSVRSFCNSLAHAKIRNGKFIKSTKYPLATLVFDQRILTNRLYNGTVRHCTTSAADTETVDKVTFERACEETLESLSDYFEEVVENVAHLKSADVSYSSGVLTINFGKPYGTYVINRQSPNQQIWLSSPTSGPKRYDFVTDGEYWVYKHDGKTLHRLLQDEIPEIVKTKVDFTKCSHCRL